MRREEVHHDLPALLLVISPDPAPAHRVGKVHSRREVFPAAALAAAPAGTVDVAPCPRDPERRGPAEEVRTVSP